MNKQNAQVHSLTNDHHKVKKKVLIKFCGNPGTHFTKCCVLQINFSGKFFCEVMAKSIQLLVSTQMIFCQWTHFG